MADNSHRVAMPMQRMPIMPAPANPMPPRQLHPAAQEAAVVYSEALHENERLRARNSQLENGLATANKHIEHLKGLLDKEQEQCEKYRRYSVEITTHLDNIVQTAVKANARAAEFSGKPQQKTELQVLTDLEQAYGDREGVTASNQELADLADVISGAALANVRKEGKEENDG